MFLVSLLALFRSLSLNDNLFHWLFPFSKASSSYKKKFISIRNLTKIMKAVNNTDLNSVWTKTPELHSFRHCEGGTTEAISLKIRGLLRRSFLTSRNDGSQPWVFGQVLNSSLDQNLVDFVMPGTRRWHGDRFVVLLTFMVYGFVTTRVVRLKLFRLKAEGVKEHDCRTLAEISDSCTKHGFKMRFFLTVFSLSIWVVARF